MTLYDYLKMQRDGHICADTYDNVYDVEVTVDADIDSEEAYADDFYYQFCFALLRVVEVESFVSGNIICKWSKLIEDNLKLFRDYSKEHWWEDCQYEDDNEEFIYQGIKELHMYYAGYVGENTYEAFKTDVLDKIIP